MCPLFLTERGFIPTNTVSKNGKYTEGMLFQFICGPYNSHHFSSIPNLLGKLTASAYADWNSSSVCSRVSF